MKRKDFIKQTVFTSASLTILGSANTDPKKCTQTPAETGGPFPTHQPATLVAENIIADRQGILLTINIAINNINNKCAGLKDVMVDIWHCDNKGDYSEYGGADEHGKHAGSGRMPPPPPTGQGPDKNHFPKRPGKGMPPGGGPGMQAMDYTKEHFLRGRQITNAIGEVSFHSIYPGWYPGRAPHIHVHVFDKTGKSLLVTQIAFPEHTSQEAYKHEAYIKHGQPDTDNASDNVFNDSIANELAIVTGNPTDGFVLTHSIYVKA
jgi:protocatechuate 3,4-dioxygenase beta subunit